MKFATNPYDITNFTLGMLHIFCRCGRKCKQIAFLVDSNFVRPIHQQIVIFPVLKIASLSPYWLQIKYPMSLRDFNFRWAVSLSGFAERFRWAVSLSGFANMSTKITTKREFRLSLSFWLSENT